MEEERQKIYTVVAIVVVVGLLFSCVAGALAGGLTGFLVGRRQGKVAAEQTLERELSNLPGFRMEYPMPWQEPIPLPGRAGALIVEVIANTPADRAGLEAGDIITAIDRIPIDANHLLPDAIGQYEPDDWITVHFWRANRQDSEPVKLSEHPDDPGRAYLGVYFEMMEGPGFESPHD
jgi:S1-C subfamily serine protease